MFTQRRVVEPAASRALLKHFARRTILDAVRHVGAGDVRGGKVAIVFLVIKEEVRTKATQQRSFGGPAKKVGFVDFDAPDAECAQRALVGGYAACRYQRYAKRTGARCK